MRELSCALTLLSAVLVFSAGAPGTQQSPQSAAQAEAQQLDHLRRFYGQDYYALGFNFNQGSFQSREAQPKDPKNRMLMSFTVDPASPNSIDWYLAQTGAKILLVDFRSLRKSTELGQWLAEPHPMRSVGSMYAAGVERSYYSAVTLTKEFDGLFFIDTANRARPNPSVKNVDKTQYLMETKRR
jgi:erythromycin esterase